MKLPTEHLLRIARLLLLTLTSVVASGQDVPSPDHQQTTDRQPRTEADLRRWLERMVWYYHYTPQEMTLATGLSKGKIDDALRRFHINKENAPLRPADSPLFVLP